MKTLDLDLNVVFVILTLLLALLASSWVHTKITKNSNKRRIIQWVTKILGYENPLVIDNFKKESCMIIPAEVEMKVDKSIKRSQIDEMLCFQLSKTLLERGLVEIELEEVREPRLNMCDASIKILIVKR